MPLSHPKRFLAILVVVIFIAEGFIMLLLHGVALRVGVLPPIVEGLADALLLVFLVFPALHWTVFQPLCGEIGRRTTAEAALEQANERLEVQVRTRTQELQRANESLRAVTETARDAIISADRQGQVVYWNQGAERIFGYPAADIVGRSLALILPERFRQAHVSGLAALAAGGPPHLAGRTIDLIGLRKGGTEFPIELSMAQWQAEGQTFFTAIIRDVTQRKQAEETLKATNRQLASINAMMVDREERMLEMKREVNALSKELGHPGRYEL
jgi:PAS domain S-box-containing protein